MNTLSVVAASTSTKLVIATIVYVIPWILLIGLVIAGIVKYFQKKGVNADSILAITNTFFQNTKIKNWFDREVHEAISIVAKSIASKADRSLSGSYDAVLKYVNAALLTILQTVESAIDTADDANEIYDVLKEYKIDVNNIEKLSKSIIESLGYDKIAIESYIKDEIKKIDSK